MKLEARKGNNDLLGVVKRPNNCGSLEPSCGGIKQSSNFLRKMYQRRMLKSSMDYLQTVTISIAFMEMFVCTVSVICVCHGVKNGISADL